jgi:ubiquinone/menaquinone biosynthesis C-methylase UbiE
MADGVARRFALAQLTVTDVDDAMVSASQTRLSHHPNVTARQADVTALPFAGASFDVVTSYLMLHHVITWQDALAEAARVLRPGGRFIGYDLTDTRMARLVHQVDGSSHQIITPSQMRDGLGVSGLIGITVNTSLAAHLMRFNATKPRLQV